MAKYEQLFNEAKKDLDNVRKELDSKNVKITAIICITILICVVLVGMFYFIAQGNKEIFEWFKNIQIFGAGCFSSLGIVGIPQIWKMLNKDKTE